MYAILSAALTPKLRLPGEPSAAHAQTHAGGGGGGCAPACALPRRRGAWPRDSAPGSAMAVAHSAGHLRQCVVSPAGRHSASLIFLHGSGALQSGGPRRRVLPLGVPCPPSPELPRAPQCSRPPAPGPGARLPPPGRVSSSSAAALWSSRSPRWWPGPLQPQHGHQGSPYPIPSSGSPRASLRRMGQPLSSGSTPGHRPLSAFPVSE